MRDVFVLTVSRDIFSRSVRRPEGSPTLHVRPPTWSQFMYLRRNVRLEGAGRGVRVGEERGRRED